MGQTLINTLWLSTPSKDVIERYEVKRSDPQVYKRPTEIIKLTTEWMVWKGPKRWALMIQINRYQIIDYENRNCLRLQDLERGDTCKDQGNRSKIIIVMYLKNLLLIYYRNDLDYKVKEKSTVE